jgi:protein gp37
MGETTAIGWTDHTFNPWIGCTKVSPACDHCYAEALRKRTGQDEWGNDVRTVTGDAYWRNPHKWNAAAEKAGERRRVFCASLADVFEDRPELDEYRARLFELIGDTDWLDWQLLTKRPENVLRMVPESWLSHGLASPWGWPANAWIGTTVEDQEHADRRIPHLLAIPAKVRFLSVEPLLGRLTLFHWLIRCRHDWANEGAPSVHARCERGGVQPGIDWVIVGGESGGGHRPLEVGFARDLKDECAQAGVPFFFKQVGGRTPTAGGDELDGRRYKEFPLAPASIGVRGPAHTAQENGA